MLEGARRSAIIFMLAVLAPSLLLAWLGFRTLRDQQTVLEVEKERACLGEAEHAAVEVRASMNALPEILGNHVANLLAKGKSTEEVASRCDELLVPTWSLARVGFAVGAGGNLLSPPAATSNTWAASFRRLDDDFLGNRVSQQAYVNKGVGLYNVRTKWEQQEASEPVPDEQEPKMNAKRRNVEPQSRLSQNDYDNGVTVIASEGSFAALIGDARQGTLARFVDDRLRLLVWNRMGDPETLFGAEIDLDRLSSELSHVLAKCPGTGSACFILLDDQGKVRGSSIPNFQPKDLARPLVSVEVGEALPHWEVAGYLLDPDAIPTGVRTIRWTVTGLIGLMLLMIAMGGFLITQDVRRQVRLARQRTDFVSNVSHELKTPLTSIRMFSEMLVEERVPDPAKQRQYLEVIGAEAGRLTRLINNVLDFARIERRETRYSKSAIDLGDIVISQLQMSDQAKQAEIQRCDTPLPISADPDAISQVVINLLSNAEKYAPESSLKITLAKEGAHGVLRICDHGPGIPHGKEEKIFERFFRLNDSLSSGTAGAGIGLTLSRQIARDHGGELRCIQSEQGACFELSLPLAT